MVKQLNQRDRHSLKLPAEFSMQVRVVSNGLFIMNLDLVFSLCFSYIYRSN